MGAFLGQVARRLCNHLRSTADLLLTLVFDDIDSQYFRDRVLADSDILFVAQLLVLCVPLRCIRSRSELLDSLAIPQHLLTTQRTTAR